uniref:Putative secreted protein n=1 Tax=Anopheles darlingi TaxID=43151 RepID=A0A2M4DEI1_ANODA
MLPRAHYWQLTWVLVRHWTIASAPRISLTKTVVVVGVGCCPGCSMGCFVARSHRPPPSDGLRSRTDPDFLSSSASLAGDRFPAVRPCCSFHPADRACSVCWDHPSYGWPSAPDRNC